MSDSLPDTVSLATFTLSSKGEEPSKTYGLAYETDDHFKGYKDELEAMKQAIFKILQTERFRYLIYSWNYGIELADLFGMPIPYVLAELPRRISEALMADDRIQKVYDFDLSYNAKGDVLCKFSVDTVYGTLTGLEKGVQTSV